MRRFRLFCWLVLGAVGAGWAAPVVRASLIVPAYNSSNFSAKIYLDFYGDTTADWGTYHPGTTPAYSTDADTNNFSQEELDNIYKIWQGVSEKYSPFRINVTTVDPHTESGATRIVIGGSGSWAPAGSGGIAIEGSWANTGSNFPNLAFVFPGHLDNGNPKYVAEASAHEAGHGFGLNHQSLYDNGNLVAEYNPGDANRAPIMGVSYYSARGQWWLGPTPDSVGIFQDDLKVISSKGGSLTNGFGYRVDDHPSLPTDAGDPLTIAPDFSISAKGIIELSTDADFFSFTAGISGEANIRADVAPFAAMLDLSLGLYDSDGNLLVSSATASLAESVDYLVSAGQTYKLGVSSAGNYGDIGQYSISGFIPEPGSASALLLLASPLLRGKTGRRRRLA
jgi:hypothetical protein